MLSEIFWTFLITSSIGLILSIARLFYKSKCKTVRCCGPNGLVEIERDVATEEKIDEQQVATTSPRVQRSVSL